MASIKYECQNCTTKKTKLRYPRTECPCGKTYHKSNKANHLNSVHHKHFINGTKKVFKPPRIVDGKYVRVLCPCGITYQVQNKYNHMKSMRHINLMKQIQGT